VVGVENMTGLHRLGERYGSWAVVVTRPVPVLAEAAVVFAGFGRMSWPRFSLMTLAANLGISAMYAGIGAFAVTAHSFLAAFGGAIALPGLLMLVVRSRYGSR
jgi:membrane protein DedA with SNARE-associated domain